MLHMVMLGIKALLVLLPADDGAGSGSKPKRRAALRAWQRPAWPQLVHLDHAAHCDPSKEFWSLL